MIEMVMVIVILGIVSMIGTDIIAKMYESYIRTQVINELQQKTELTIDQISKRLKYRIKPSTVAKNLQNTAIFKELSNDTNDIYNVLEWIGYDNEGFKGDWNGALNRYTPGWSGFIDLNATGDTNTSQVSTKGSTLTAAERYIDILSYGDINISSAVATDQYPALIFKKLDNIEPVTFGFDPTRNEANNTLPVRALTNDILEFVGNDRNKTLYEQYYLAWSAYAIAPENTDNNESFDLFLHYNYQPWYNERFDDTNTTRRRVLLAEDVSTFVFTQTGSTIQIKLCIQDGNKTGVPIVFCKEKAIF
jgi:hypothetical protein